MKVLADQLQRSVCRTLQTEQLHEMHHRRLYVLNSGPLVRWQQCCPVLLPLSGSIRSLSPRQIHTYTPRMALNAATAAREARWTSNTRHTGHWLDPRTWSWNCARTIADDFISRWDGSWSRGHFWSAPALPLRFFVHLIAVCARAGYVTRAPIANCSSRLLRSGPRPDPTPLLVTVAAVCSVCQCVLGGANDGASVMMQSVRSRNRGKQTALHRHTHTLAG